MSLAFIDPGVWVAVHLYSLPSICHITNMHLPHADAFTKLSLAFIDARVGIIADPDSLHCICCITNMHLPYVLVFQTCS